MALKLIFETYLLTVKNAERYAGSIAQYFLFLALDLYNTP